jgi:aspartate aminotransferase
MPLVTPQIEEYLRTQSWIRRMFEAASELAARHGAENVFDFSLGNPDVAPPAEVARALEGVVSTLGRPLSLGYCPNAGLPEVRAALAERIGKEQETSLDAAHVIVTAGAAGALNAIFRTILRQGDEVVCVAPYFVEYGFYAANHGGTLKPAPARPLTFEIDPSALETAITPSTRAVIINSPNNPTGVVYSREQMRAVAAVLEKKSAEFGRPVLLVSDEPYRFLVYDGAEVPPLMPLYPSTIIVSSFSKSLSMAGERIGYIAVNPAIEGAGMLLDGMILANRILGFVNAPVIGQRLVRAALSAGVDTAVYERRRGVMARILDEHGIEYAMPKGAFYFFPKVPGGRSDVEFVGLLMEEKIIAVPGSGFGYPGHFRLAYCVEAATIERSAPAWRRAMKRPG